MSYTNGLDKPSDYFNTVLYTANNGTLNVTGVGFQPDWVWIKGRSYTVHSNMYDVVRGVQKDLLSGSTNAETSSGELTAFNSDGFTVVDSGTDRANYLTNTHVSWNWKAGTSFTNDASATGIGSIDSTGSFNNDSGFSIVSYTGTGSNGTVKHGLTSAPKHIIIKRRDSAEQFINYHHTIGNTGGVYLNLTNAAVDNNTWFNDTSPTSTVFSIGTNGKSNASSGTYIAYCFAEKQGYSKFGSYTGNGNADGTFVYTGFKPAWLMIKKSSATEEWYMYDNKRTPFNEIAKGLAANLSGAEFDTGATIDFLSNGFKNTGTNTGTNASGATYIYMAFAENPFVTSTGVCATAR